MTLVRWTTPRTRNFRTLDQAMNDLWRANWAQRPAEYDSDTARPVFRPAMDVVETENGFTVRIDLPGIAPDNVTVEFEDGLLTISGELADTVEQEDARYHYRERRSGAFKRVLRLNDKLDVDNIQAAFDNGVLVLDVPKRPETQPKRIAVQHN